MIESEIIEKLKGTSIEERILVIEAILQTVKNEMRSTSSKDLSENPSKPLKGKLIRYEYPYEPVWSQQTWRC